MAVFVAISIHNVLMLEDHIVSLNFKQKSEMKWTHLFMTQIRKQDG